MLNTPGLNELREKFLTFFESKGHTRLASFSLIPQNDNSLLIVNSGMAPLKPYFTGRETPPSSRLCTCQKCVRTGDIDEVGKDGRHGTFFEMLGNFSFGDYFKEEALKWSWEFLTETVGLDKTRLYPSVYEQDDEAYNIWRDVIGIAPERIYKLGKADNFWEHGAGPCGPSSEIYYDRGEEYGCGKDTCAAGCECDRFMEVWNDVFTQFDGDGDGHYTTLEKKNIDTGMGLERLALVVQNAASIFDVDTIAAIREAVCAVTGAKYGESAKGDASVRIITDHIRSVTFMLADGILPGNEGRGYVLRRLLRRAARHGRLLGVKTPFLAKLSGVVIGASGGAYPELDEKRDYIFKLLNIEETRFGETLDKGTDVLRELAEKVKASGKTVFGGADAFMLYDTYGFPVELTKEILEDYGLTADEAGFAANMAKQRETARSAREETTYMGSADTVFGKLPVDITTKFVGYEKYDGEGNITAVIVGDALADSAAEGDSVSVITDVSPFYAEMGGQKGDGGVIETETGTVVVTDCVKAGDNRRAHVGTVVKGAVYVGQKAALKLDADKRLDIARNHTATHLLQRALREVLGGHVEQAGSMVSADRLRFDFTHFEPISDGDLVKIEDIVNDAILKGLPVEITEKSMDEARKQGATALFGEKYGDVVRVVDMGGWSVELCGGTHLTNTSNAGLFKIVSEGGVAAGVRRIEAVTGRNVINRMRETGLLLWSAANALKTSPDQIVKKAEQITVQMREFAKAAEQMRSRLAGGAVESVAASRETINGVNVMTAALSADTAIEVSGLRDFYDKVRDRFAQGEPTVVVLAGGSAEKSGLLAAANEEAVKRGINCGLIIKESAAVAGGNGGGRPNMAQAGVKDHTKLGAAVAKAREIIVEQLK